MLGGGGVNWADTGGIRDRRAHSPAARRSTSVGARRDRAGGPLLSRRPGATASSQLTPRRSLAESLRSTSGQMSPASSPSPTRHADALRSTFSASPDELEETSSGALSRGRGEEGALAWTTLRRFFCGFAEELNVTNE